MLPRCLALPAALSAALAVSAASAAQKPEQLVIVSFDGAHDNALWVRSLDMAARVHAHVTYFFSCTYLMTKGSPIAQAYKAPGHRPGTSATGFAQSIPEIAERVGHIWQAHLAGHDIASHACGHFDGASWSEAEWQHEFQAFTATLRDGWKTGGIAGQEPKGWADFVTHGITGFRAPYLSTGPALQAAIREHGFRYDASLITRGPALPDITRGLVRFGLPLIPEGPKQKPVIAMDYNLYVRHSGAKEDLAQAATYEARSLAAYRAAFARQYDGNRLPLQLGFHFVAMNGGVYWRALDTFLAETCQKPGVACVSYAEALDRLKPRSPVEKAENGTPAARHL
nr:polysaccharide deacetylase [uncultured Gellertiella sp.]